MQLGPLTGNINLTLESLLKDLEKGQPRSSFSGLLNSLVRSTRIPCSNSDFLILKQGEVVEGESLIWVRCKGVALDHNEEQSKAS